MQPNPSELELAAAEGVKRINRSLGWCDCGAMMEEDIDEWICERCDRLFDLTGEEIEVK
jgi:hypothetical protein